MAKREYDPPIAARIPKDDWVYLVDLSSRRSELLSITIRNAIKQYVEKCKESDTKLGRLR